MDILIDLSIVTDAWASAAEHANIPVIGTNITEAANFQNPGFYAPGQTADSSAYADIITAKAAGVTSLADLYCAEAPACSQGFALQKAQAQKQSLPLVYGVSYSSTAPNYTAQCLAAKQAHANGLFIGGTGTIIVRIGSDCANQSFDPVFLTEGEGFSMNQAKLHMWSEYGDIPFFANNAEIQKMNAAVDKYFPGIRNNDTTWSQLAEQGWASGLLITDVVKSAGVTASSAPSAAAIEKGLESLHGDTLDGMSPPLTFPAGQPHPIDCWFTGKVENATPSVVNNGQVTCEHS